MSSLSWAQRFGISDRELQNLTSTSAGDPLHVALVSGRVPEAEYFKWAAETYELPCVKTEFFRVPVDPVFYAAVKQDFEWTPWFVPLAEWNGVLLIGCLEPPRFHFRVNYETRFVLASATDLATRFGALEPATRVVVPSATPVVVAKAPDEITPPAVSPSDEVTNAAIEATNTAVEVTNASPSVIAMPPPQVPSVPPPLPRADSVATPPLPPKTAKKITEMPDIPLPDAPDISLDEPDGLVVKPTDTPHQLMVVPDGMRLNAVEIPKPAAAVAEEVTAVDAPEGLSEKTYTGKQNVDFSAYTTSSRVAGAMAPPRLSDLTAKAESATVSTPPPVFETPTGTAIPYPEKQTPPTLQQDFNTAAGAKIDSAIVRDDVKVLPLASCTNYEDLAGSALGRVLKSFDVGMILLFQNSQLKPWKWTELFHSVKGNDVDAVDLGPASIFRIVFRTCLPYHGYVVPNAVNTAFFNLFYRGVTPKHATVVPVMINKKVAGMILGFSNAEVDLKKTLGEMEVLAAEFGTHLDRVKSAQKKAA